MSPLKINSLTVHDLIHLSLKGDRSAQKNLFEMFAPKMLTVCRRYSRHQMEAEDLLQDGFVKVFTKLDRFEFSGSFEGWVRRIMINTALKSISRKSFTNEQIGLEDHKGGSAGPAVFNKLSEEELLKLINDLPDGYKFVFNMYVIEGYSHKEIGEILEIGESTSRSQLVKARRILQQKVLELQKIAV